MIFLILFGIPGLLLVIFWRLGKVNKLLRKAAWSNERKLEEEKKEEARWESKRFIGFIVALIIILWLISSLFQS